MEHVHAVRPVDGHAAPPGDEPDDLISGNRIAAFGEPDGHIVDALDDNAALGLGDVHLLLVRLRDLLQDRLVGDLFFVFFLVLLLQPVDYLAFLQAAVPDGRQHGVPVAEPVFFLHDLLVLRLQDIEQFDIFTAAVGCDQLLAADDIVFFKFFLKPLIDLVLGLRALDDIQPVPARSPGILGRQDLDPVAVLDLVIDIDKLPVYPGADHFIAHCTVDGVGKIHRRGTVRQILHIAVRREAVHIIRKQVQVAFEQA